MSGRKGLRRRSWSREEKRRIVAESFAPGSSVASVALQHGINVNLVFKWRQDPRFCGEAALPSFFPVAVSQAPDEAVLNGACLPEPAENAPSGTVLEIGGGMRLRFGGPVSAACLIRLVSELKGAS